MSYPCEENDIIVRIVQLSSRKSTENNVQPKLLDSKNSISYLNEINIYCTSLLEKLVNSLCARDLTSCQTLEIRLIIYNYNNNNNNNNNVSLLQLQTNAATDRPTHNICHAGQYVHSSAR